MSRPERILVTGAAGFIGSSLVDKLLAEGREVVGYDSFDPYYPEEQKHRNLASAMAQPGFELVRGDIRDVKTVEQVFEHGRFDGVVHLAALAGVRPSLQRPADYADVNVNGTTVLLEAATRNGNPRFVFASSSSVYGEREDGPFRESDPVERPISPYAATKRAGELMAHTFHHAHGLSVTCARIFTAYGPRQRPDLAIRKFAELMLAGELLPVYGDGSALRDFTFIGDLVEGLVRALDTDLGFRILNLGAGRSVVLRDVIHELERALGVAAQLDLQSRQPGEVTKTWSDTSAAREALGYEPRTSLTEGIDRFVDWLRATK
jgi:UDP-glucuronate 4-epimerase